MLRTQTQIAGADGSAAPSTDGRAAASARRPKHAMTVDVEEYFQVWALSERIDRDDWDSFAPRVVDSTRIVLDLLEQSASTATFFILGWIAKRHKELVREIADAGHEVASHGWEHYKVHEQSPEEFYDDVARTKHLLEDITGGPVVGYRAPSFSISKDCWWAYEVLAETGHHYSSSLHPIAHDHYDGAAAPRYPFLPTGAGGVTEIPVATTTIFGKRRPCGGGGYFRLMPYPWTKYCWSKIEREDARPATFYLHPWEVDGDQPRLDGLSLKSRFRHYVNLDKTAPRLRRLMSDFTWRRMDMVYKTEIFEKPEELVQFDNAMLRSRA